MSDEKTSLKAAIRHLAEQERRTPAEHATPGELAAYHEGTLPPQIEARVREHLAHCRACSDLLLDLAGFADLAPPPGVPELTDAEVEEDWQALRGKLDEAKDKPSISEEPPGEVVPIRRPSTPKPAKPDREFLPWKVVAAAALAATVGLSAWVVVLKRNEGAGAKGGQMVIFDDGGQLRGGDQDRLPSMLSSQPATFLFYSDKAYPMYEGEIVAGKTLVWQVQFKFNVPSPQPDPIPVSFWIPGGTLEPGQYEARLYGIGDSGKRPIGRLDLEVDAP